MKTYTTNKKQNIISKAGEWLFVCLFWIVAWYALAMIVSNTLLLPSPKETVIALGFLLGQKKFYLDVSWTILRCILAMVLSFAAGAVGAAAAYKSRWIRRILTLPVSFFKAVPVMAVVIYVILLLESNWVAVAACFLMCFPIVYTNLLAGLDSCDRELLEVARIYGLSAFRTASLIFFPWIQPQMKAAVKLISGLSWKAVVAAEVLSIPKYSLGYGMINAKYYLETEQLFAYIAVIVILSMTMEKCINQWVEKKEQCGYKGSRLGSGTSDTSSNNDLYRQDTVELCNLTKSFGEKKVLEGFSAVIETGKTTCISGPSGVGKTTVARIIAGLEKADEGTVEGASDKRVAYLFQEDRLLPWLNVYDNLALSMIGEGRYIKDGEVVAMAESLGLGDNLWQLPDQLSGGMRHRVALGRTLLANAEIIILDEPFRGLDKELKESIVNKLYDRYIEGKTLILISHNDEDKELLKTEKTYFVQ